MTASEALNNYFLSLSIEGKANLTRELINQLEITPNTLKNWRYSYSRIKLVYRREISRIIGNDIFAEVTD